MQADPNLPGPYTPHASLVAAMNACPLIAILRGLTPEEAAAHGQALYEAGFRMLEVPLNSPRPYESIAALRAALPADALIGAGTVLRVDQVGEVKAAGGTLIVMPHADPEVVSEAKRLELVCTPGVATPTEAFIALKHGADALKMFPAEQLGPVPLKAWRAVIPKVVPIVPVGGITPDNMGPFLAAGASGFGLGSALYAPGQDPTVTRKHAEAYVNGLRIARAGVNK